MRPSELAQLARVSTDTLRHYERVGILPTAPRTASGYRMYPTDALELVRLVQRALQLELTLAKRRSLPIISPFKRTIAIVLDVG